MKFWRVDDELRRSVLRVAVLAVRALAVSEPIVPTLEKKLVLDAVCEI